MSRAERLLTLLETLRRHRHPVTGVRLASELGVSLRTLYRDIASLQAQGATIDGAPGLGYVLRPGFVLPPLMFTADEVEALVLGSRFVADRGDEALARAARTALSKIGAVLPPDSRVHAETSALLIGPAAGAERAHLLAVRTAIRGERKLTIDYRDLAGRDTQRTIWPFALGFFDRAQVAVAHCELRGAIRHFRLDRIAAVTDTGQRYPARRHDLMKQWRRMQTMDAAADEN
ncbi:MAG: YafY family protein [Burkholderiales bacterium]